VYNIVKRYKELRTDRHEVMKRTDYQAMAEFRHQIRCFLNFSEQAARTAGLEPQQHQLLLALKGLPAGKKATIGYLAERLQLQHHSAVELVDRLERHGLVRRCQGDKDRREVLLRVTPQGEKVLRALSLHHRAILRSAGPALVRALEQLLAGMEQKGTADGARPPVPADRTAGNSP
jgi:DNA-binding MarR family transcriptional regulator